MGNNSLRCLHCGVEYAMTLPCSIAMLSAMSKTFIAEHADCKASDAGRARFEATTALEWRASWHTGISSIAIYDFMTIGKRPGDTAIPLDPSDFGRCYRLLKIVPAWRARLGELGACSAGWRPLVEAWAEMERLYEAELADGTGSAPELYALMRRLQGRTP